MKKTFLSMQAAMQKKIEAEIDQINAQIDDVSRSSEDAKAELTKSIDLLRKAFDSGELRRQKDIDKLIREFMVVKGEVGEKISEVSLEIGEFSKMAESLRKQVLKESLDGVHEKTKAIFGEMEKKFETVEDGLVDKISSLESDFDEFNAGFQGTVSMLKAETDRKIEFLKKEFDKRDASRDKEAAAFSKTLQRDMNAKFSVVEGTIGNRLKAAEDEITSLTKATDNFTVELSEKFDSIIKAKTAEFGREVKSLVTDMKSMEKDVNLAIGAFKSDMEKSEMKKRAEIDRTLREFVAAKGKIDEKMEQVDRRISEFSQIKKELKKEIYNESLSGVQERVKDIVAGIEERFNASRDEMDGRISELVKGSDARIRETETSLNSFRVELERTVGKLRTDVDKVTVKKADEINKIAAGLRKDFEDKAEIVNSEIFQNFEQMRGEITGVRAELAKSVAFVRKELETGELKRDGKAEKAKLALDKEFNAKFSEYAYAMSARVKSIEADIKAMNGSLTNATSQLKDKFDDIISEKMDSFEVSMEETTEKADKARKDVEILADNLKGKFQSGEASRRMETDKYVKELMIVKGEMTRRMKEVDDQIRKFSDLKISLKNELMKESILMVDGKLASLDLSKKREMADSRKSLKTEISELHVFLNNVADKVGKLSDKLDGVKEDIFAVKKSRTLLVDNVKSLGRTIDENSDAKMSTFLREMDKRMKTQEQIIGARMAELEKRMNAVSEHTAKTKKEKEEELDELLKHVES